MGRKECTGKMELVTDAFSQIELAYASGQAGVAGICLILDPSSASSLFIDFTYVLDSPLCLSRIRRIAVLQICTFFT
jgi:hypothetical protein